MMPQFLVVGHVCHDLHEGGARLGGTAAYASLTAQRLGLKAALLTRSAEQDLTSLLPGVCVLNRPSPVTTTFRNEYLPGRRRQRLHSVAPPIKADDLPQAWRGCPIVLIGPVAQEVEPPLARAFADSLIGISPQGWMRHWDRQGYVSHVPWDGEALQGLGDMVMVGEDDLPTGEPPDNWLPWVPVLIVTEGEKGARIRCRGSWHRIPAYPAQEVDPTGAGDVFAAAYLVRYHETNDPFSAALFASCAASISVEAPGLEGVPTRKQVEQRLERHPENRAQPLPGLLE